jgi:hypothetical protein
MKTSDNKKRVLDLVWKNYDGQVAATRRASDRVAIVLGASVAGIGLMFKDIPSGTQFNLGVQVSILVMLVAMISAFVFACCAWTPSPVGVPSSTDRDRLWHFLVNVDDDCSASTLIGDICKATDEEENFTLRVTSWLKACMISCGVAVAASMAVKLFSVTCQ